VGLHALDHGFTHGALWARNSSGVRLRMYSPFMCAIFFTSKNAGECDTSSSRNCSISVASGTISSSPRGLHPSSAR
jgi:hypothetical protein